jgi:hypothetical protein
MTISHDLNLDTHLDEDETGCDLVDHDHDDGDATGETGEITYDDRLSEAIQGRIRPYLPHGIQAAGERQEGYLEVYTESAKALNDDLLVTVVGVALVEDRFHDQAEGLRGTLVDDLLGNGQVLELGYRQIDDGFIFDIRLDGKTVKSYREPELAKMAFDLCCGRNPEGFRAAFHMALGLYTSGIRHIETSGNAEVVDTEEEEM